MICFTKVSKKWEEMNPRFMLFVGKFRSVSSWDVRQLRNTLLKEKVLWEGGWNIKYDVFAAICTDFCEALFSMQLSSQADMRVVVFDSILTARLTLGS